MAQWTKALVMPAYQPGFSNPRTQSASTCGPWLMCTDTLILTLPFSPSLPIDTLLKRSNFPGSFEKWRGCKDSAGDSP